MKEETKPPFGSKVPLSALQVEMGLIHSGMVLNLLYRVRICTISNAAYFSRFGRRTSTLSAGIVMTV